MKFLSRDIVLDDRRTISFPGHFSPSKLFIRKISAVIVELRNNFSIERKERLGGRGRFRKTYSSIVHRLLNTGRNDFPLVLSVANRYVRRDEFPRT